MARPSPDVADLTAELRRSPLSNAASLIWTLGLGSQATLSRLIVRAGEDVVPIGRARARRYAAARAVRGLPYEIPLFRIDARGSLERIAGIRTFAPGGHFVDGAEKLPRWMRGHRGDGVFEGLPVFLVDQRPQGFLGRTFARRNAELGLSDNPETWTDDDCTFALAKSGEDCVGDLVVGDESARRLYAAWAAGQTIIPLAQRAVVYPALAEEAINGVAPGSSAGGEQPKFGAIVADRLSPIPILVKFSPGDDSPAADRWRDLLIAEHLALQTLRRHKVPTVRSEILEAGGRVFLQTMRFDREGARGRRPVISLHAMNGEYVGIAAGAGAGRWLDAIERLQRDRWLSPATVAQVRDLHAFGQFIANSDMHFGNLSLLPLNDGTLALAPVYDMLPMSYAPVAGEVPARHFEPPLPEPGEEAAWLRAGERAIEFWQAVASESRVSGAFRKIAADNAAATAKALARFGHAFE
ncbi:MAG: type II toxin-antitoxin system HipA family toxin YjjJ [Casimicrobiaceae bacterium]